MLAINSNDRALAYHPSRRFGDLSPPALGFGRPVGRWYNPPGQGEAVRLRGSRWNI